MEHADPRTSIGPNSLSGAIFLARTQRPEGLDGRRLLRTATLVTCSILENRKQLATGSFTSRGPSSRYSWSGGCFGCTYCECLQTPSGDRGLPHEVRHPRPGDFDTLNWPTNDHLNWPT